MSASTGQVGGTHYITAAVQPWDVIDTWPLADRVGFYRGNALKYLLRAGTKGGASEDYAKAAHYIEKLIETLTQNGPEQRSRAEPALNTEPRSGPNV